MAPETLKSTCIMFRTELERQGASLGIMTVFDSMCSYLGGESRDLNRALAALEEAQHLFQDHGPQGRNYTNMQYVTLQQELAEAQQTIARVQKRINEQTVWTGEDGKELAGDIESIISGETQP